MVFKCAKGLFRRLGPAVLEKKLEMLKLEQESNLRKVLQWRMIPREHGQSQMEVSVLLGASFLKVQGN